MTTTKAPHIATEKFDLERALQALPVVSGRAHKVLKRVRNVCSLPEQMDILEVGAAQGLFLIACAQSQHRAIGVEPSDDAAAVGNEIARRLGVSIDIRKGYAERLPADAESVDFVYATSVIEHVDDAAAAFREAWRVLRPGGAFYFATASSMCPLQDEIRGFPLFGWYPNPLKIRIMQWACVHKPGLIGHTTRPAIHWFTPWKARRMLRSAGFSRIFDRWDLRLPEEGNNVYAAGLRAVKLNFFTKCVADVIVPGCSYLAVK